MTLFKKKVDRINLNNTQQKIAQGLASVINKMQCCWVDWINRLMAKCSAKNQKVFFFLYLLFMLSGVSYVTIKTLMNLHDKKLIEGFAKSQPVILQRPEIKRPVLTEIMPDRIKVFKRMVDSLGNTEHGNLELDSFLKARPGLLDSLRKIEKLYQ